MIDKHFFEDCAEGVTTIDTGYHRPRMVASHLVIDAGRAAFIDAGTTHSVPRLLGVLADKGIATTAVDYVIVTHVHLDHAGGAGRLMQLLPNAQLVVHPRGARHLIDPARLLEGTIEVYGAAKTQALYGEIPPVPAARVIQATDEYELELGQRRLLFIDTPGHAKHHFCVVDEEHRSIFTGDTFGLSYREFDTAQGTFIFPTTTPVQFDPGALHASIKRLMDYAPEKIYLTHYGEIRDLARLADDLHLLIDSFVGLARETAHVEPEQRQAVLTQRLFETLWARLQAHGVSLSAAVCHDLLAPDLALNAQGLILWWDKTQAMVS